MLRAYAWEYAGNWDYNLPLVEFAYNNSYYSSIEMTLYETLYGRRCRTPVCWNEVGERKLSKFELIDQTKEIINKIRKNYEQLRVDKRAMQTYAEGH